jgi:monooxygenase
MFEGLSMHNPVDAVSEIATPPGSVDYFDVLIVGAGLSGIGAAAHLQDQLPGKTYAILESRQALGGTWDLFRYPGVRSDSDMYTLGYAFKPWTGSKSIADGASIKSYIAEVAVERGIDRHIKYGHRAVRAQWSSQEAAWTVVVEREGQGQILIRCNFLLMCAGYYSYAEGYRPRFAGEENFTGQLVHPQFWPENLDYRGKKIVVIGSGATAVTLLPELARTAAHVVMLQRSPTYIVSRPSVDRLAGWLQGKFSAKTAYRVTRLKNVLYNQIVYSMARKSPTIVKRLIAKGLREGLGPTYDIKRHFTPTYNPWDQRLCAVPDADLFKAIRSGRASVATGTIESFTATGIRLTCGAELDADLVITATGLKVNLLGDVMFFVDGVQIDMSKSMNYKSCLFSGVPNLASIFGYTNASWTLKSDLTSAYLCRLLKRMDENRTPIVTARRDASMTEEPFIDLNSGFVVRSSSLLPKQGSKHPWKRYQNYLLDLMTFRFGRLSDGTLEFRKRPATVHSGVDGHVFGGCNTQPREGHDQVV